jgi:hypothetical protein
LPLSDSTLQPKNNIKALTHDYLKMAGKDVMQAVYPAGSWNLQNTPRGGVSFYAPGPAGALDLSKAREVLFSYSVYFPKGFEFVMGGKLPGLYGGDNQKDSESCSGGRRDDGCFSARLMWRTDGAGEMYTYLPPSIEANKAVCAVGPYSECNPTYGASVGRGSFTFATGAWTTVAMRVRLNSVGKEDGELQLWANGQSMFSVGGLVLRTSDDARIWGIQMQTFFGGKVSHMSDGCVLNVPRRINAGVEHPNQAGDLLCGLLDGRHRRALNGTLASPQAERFNIQDCIPSSHYRLLWTVSRYHCCIIFLYITLDRVGCAVTPCALHVHT